MVVEDLAHALLGVAVLVAEDAGTHAVGLDRVVAHDPVGNVQVMDVLLADVVAGEPGEVVPVLDLILHLGLAGTAIAEPDAVAVPVDPRQDQFAVLAVVNFLDPALVARVVAALQADNHLEALFVSQLVGLHELVEAGGVHAARLFHEDVLAGVDGVLVMGRAETGRRSLDDHVHARVDGLLVGVQPHEDVVRGDVGLAFLLEGPVQAVGRAAGIAFEGVGYGHDLHLLVGA